jgi:heme-degrading monooxygenase HmoA
MRAPPLPVCSPAATGTVLAQLIRSVLYLTPRGGDGSAVVGFYRRRRVLERALEQDGCLGAELQLPVDGTRDVLVTALWRDADAYRGWLENPVRSAHARELAELVEDFDAGVRGAVYEIAHQVQP